jgi:hypothetical protein
MGDLFQTANGVLLVAVSLPHYNTQIQIITYKIRISNTQYNTTKRANKT